MDSNKSQPIKIFLITFAIVLGVMGYFDLKGVFVNYIDQLNVVPLSGTTPLYKFSVIATSTASVGNARTQVVGADRNRTYLLIENTSANPLICLAEGAVSAANSAVATSSNTRGIYGHYINAMSTTTQASNKWELSGYTGVVNCAKEGSLANATATITTSP